MIQYEKIREWVIGAPLDPLSQSTRQHIALAAFIAWVGLGADGLSSSAYGPEEAFKALGDHTQLGLYMAIATAATSGEYARGTHVFDPHTHLPPTGILSVTITGPDLATADAFATAAFAMGAERATHWTARLRGYEAMTILADGRVLSTPGFTR